MIDLGSATREELIHLNFQLIARLQTLEEHVKQLEAELTSLRGGGGQSSPPSFVKQILPLAIRKRSARSGHTDLLANSIWLLRASSTRLSNAQTAGLISEATV